MKNNRRHSYDAWLSFRGGIVILADTIVANDIPDAIKNLKKMNGGKHEQLHNQYVAKIVLVRFKRQLIENNITLPPEMLLNLRGLTFTNSDTRSATIQSMVTTIGLTIFSAVEGHSFEDLFEYITPWAHRGSSFAHQEMIEEEKKVVDGSSMGGSNKQEEVERLNAAWGITNEA